jgi:hypothetical protein
MKTWERRDVPVLRALAETEDENLRHGFLELSRHGGAAGQRLGLDLTDTEIYDAILALGDAYYIEGEIAYHGGGAMVTHLSVTGYGEQALDEWPLFDELTPSTLALLLERLAAEAPTPEERSSAKRAATYARSLTPAAVKAAARTALVMGAKAGIGLLT